MALFFSSLATASFAAQIPLTQAVKMALHAEGKMTAEPSTEDSIHDVTPQANPLPWWQQHQLRNLYLMMPFLFLGSTTLGYDGSLLNGLQTMKTWRDCKSHTMNPSIYNG